MVGRMQGVSSAGLEAQLYGRQDACRYLGCGVKIQAYGIAPKIKRWRSLMILIPR